MEFETMHESTILEVPNDNICLESHESLLARSDVFARFGDCDDGDLVVVPSQECLRTRDYVSDDYRGSKRID